jgi:predicted nucleotidyltransferase
MTIKQTSEDDSVKDLSPILHQLRQEFTQLWGSRLSAVYLYGSQARGDAQPDSDVDILAVIRGDFDYFEMLHSTDAIVSRLSLENNLVITLSLASEDCLKNSPLSLFRNVRQEGVPV